jgi:hypothetical protein
VEGLLPPACASTWRNCGLRSAAAILVAAIVLPVLNITNVLPARSLSGVIQGMLALLAEELRAQALPQ